MWILPKTKPLSVFAPDTVELKEDLQKLVEVADNMRAYLNGGVQ